MRVFLAGRVAVEVDGGPIDDQCLPGRQARLLFAYLVVERDRPVPRDELADAIWGESPPATWDKALSMIVSRVRAALAGLGVDAATALTGAFGCYRLVLPAGTWVDVIAAADGVREAERALVAGDLDEAVNAASHAASLLQGPFVPGVEADWVEAKRRELADLRGRALETLTDACLRSGDAPQAAHWAEQTIAAAPFRESAYRRLMEAHIAAGNRAEALRVYERCRRLLAEELGAYPSPETESVYRGLLEARATAPARPRSAPAPATSRRVVSRKRIGIAVAAAAVAAIGVGAVVTEGAAKHGPTVSADAVGVIDPHDSRVAGQVAVGRAPTAVAEGEGAVWTTNASSDTVSRIDPATRTVQQTISVGASPTGIAVGGGGIWVANHDDDTVSWISPQSDDVVRRIHVGAGPTAVTYGFGSVWVTNADDRTVTRIDPETGDVVKTIPTKAVGAGMTVGGGLVWVTDEATRTIDGIDPATNEVTASAPVGAGPIGIAYGDGSLWVANALENTVSRVDATTLAGRGTIPVPDGPNAVAFANGAVWVSEEFGSRLARIDPRRGVVAGTTPVGNRPEGLTSAKGRVWVAVQPSGQGHRGGRLIVLGDSLDTIDPTVSNSTTSVALLATAYDGLTSFRRVGGAAGTELVPDLAAALPTPTGGGRTYTFHLRAGIRYSDGRPLRAIDLRRGLARQLVLDGPMARYFADLPGAAGCLRHGRCDLSRSVVVDGPRTLTFRLPSRDPRFFRDLTGIEPVPAGTRFGVTRPIPSTGPYTIRSYVPGRLLTLVRNRYFHVWSAAAQPDGYPDEIIFRTTTREASAVRDVLAGRADLLLQGYLSGAEVQRLAARHPLQLHLDPEQATTFVFLNVRRTPFDDVRVRRALNFAVDRKRVAALHGAPLAQPTCQLVPPTVSGYRPYCPYTVDPNASGAWTAADLAKARALIHASGTRGQTVVVWSFSYFHRESEYLVALLRRLGYRAHLHYIPDMGHYFAALDHMPSAQAGFVGWFGSQLAVDTLEEAGCHAPLENWAHFCNPRISDQIAELAKQPPGGQQTAALAAKIDRETTDEAPWVPLFTPRLPQLTSARVGNYEDPSGQFVLLDQLWVR